MRNLKILVAMVAALTALASHAGPQVFEILELAAETSSLRLNGSNDQLLYVKDCDHCATVAVSVNAKTAFFDDKQPVNAATAARIRGRDATVFYHPQTREVTRIIFWQRVQS